jgi:hypothetical protein
MRTNRSVRFGFQRGMPCWWVGVVFRCRFTRQLVLVDVGASQLGKYFWLDVRFFRSLILSISTHTEKAIAK